MWLGIKNFFWNIPVWADRFRLIPRLMLGTYTWILIEMTLWYIGLPTPTANQATFITATLAIFPAVFSAYLGLGKNTGLSQTHELKAVTVKKEYKPKENKKPKTTYVPKVKKSGRKSKSPTIKGTQG